MRKPIVLITTSNVNSSALEGVTGDTDILYSDRATTTAVINAGGIPLYVPSITLLRASDLNEYLNRADAVLITGADTNVNPLYYGEKPSHLDGRIDDERDHTDIGLIKSAHRKRLPILGICKGMQIIAVALGGTLYQNIATQHPGAFNHDIKKTSRSNFTHMARLAPGSMLYEIFGSDKFSLNGGHQQAVRSLPPTLKQTAVAEDDVIEAFEGVDYPFLLGVQFHAELRTSDPAFAEIFKRFIAVAAGGKRENGVALSVSVKHQEGDT